jgi:excisionase family DNA binding protein
MTDRHQAGDHQLLTVNAAAAFLGCSRTTVYALIEAGELPVIAVGRSRGYRIERQDLEEFMRRRRFLKEGRAPQRSTQRISLKHIKL